MTSGKVTASDSGWVWWEGAWVDRQLDFVEYLTTCFIIKL